MEEQLSFEEAKRLSLFKWKILLTNPLSKAIDIFHANLELDNLKHYDGFCERWSYNDSTYMDCPKCEFGKIAGRCLMETSLYYKYHMEKNLSLKKKIIKQICNVIKNLKPNT